MNKYEIILDVYRSGSITQTAEKYHYSQSAVSQVIKSFEDEIGIRLFRRSKSGTSLLPNSEGIIDAVRIICEQQDDILRTASKLSKLEIGHIRIGTIHSVFYNWLSDMLKEFSDRYPAIQFDITVGGFDELRAGLSERAFDCIFVSRYAAMEYDFIPIATDELILVMPQGHQLLDKPALQLEDLNDEDYILSSDRLDYETGKLFALHGVKPRIRFALNDDYGCLKMVESGFGVSILPKLLVDKAPFYVETRSFHSRIDRVLGIAFVRAEVQIPAMLRFFSFVRKYEFV